MRRFTAAAEKVFAVLSREMAAEAATENLLNMPCDLQKEMLKHEGALIKQALAKTNGRLTEAASQLTLSYQALAYISRRKAEGPAKEPYADPAALKEGLRIGSAQRVDTKLLAWSALRSDVKVGRVLVW